MLKKALLSAFVLASCGAHALYNGAPSLPHVTETGFFFNKDDWFALKVGYQGDLLIDRSLRPTNNRIKRMDVFGYHLNQGVITANFVDRFEVYSSLGAAKFFIEPRVTETTRLSMETGNRFTWGVGARGVLYEVSKFTFGMDVKYQEANPSFQWISLNGAPIGPTGGAKLKYQEWQIGLGVSYRIELFTPYIVGRYCQTLSRYKHFPLGLLANNATSFRVKSRKKFGISVGATLSSGNIFDMDFEARMIDETAATIALTVRI
ncbi:MAG: Major outer membrane porin [Chlamydiia bacterium]|nr:Major outer membrane porin [Chlamydiia bacterium]